MAKYKILAFASSLSISAFASESAFAECVVPNVIANGQVADASKVMDNFTAIAGCVDAGVKPTGSPQSGSIVVFSGTQTVTNGDLSGDVTTSGGTTATLRDTGVAPGLYVNPNITVDAKGRIVSATNGAGGGSGGGSDWVEIALTNPGAETGTTEGWTMLGGGFTASTANPAGHNMTPIWGTSAFVATSNASPSMIQAVDVATFAVDVDAGKVLAQFEAYAADTFTTGENPYLFIEFRNATGSRIGIAITPAQTRSIGSGVWRYLRVEGRIPPGTRSLGLALWASRADGTANNVAFDAARAFMRIE